MKQYPIFNALKLPFLIKHRTISTFLSLLTLPIIFTLSCSDLTISPYDKSFKGDYKLITDFSKDTLHAFVCYKFHYTTGSDSFASLSVYSPSSVVDTALFVGITDADSLCLYFTSYFYGDIGIIGIRPNGLSDTFNFPVFVKNSININSIFTPGISDYYKFFLVPGVSNKALNNIKNVIWYFDTLAIDTLNPEDTLLLEINKNVSSKISAQICDFLGNSTMIDYEFSYLHTPKPAITSLSTKGTTFPGDSVFLDFQIISFVGDTGKLTIICEDTIVMQDVIFDKYNIKQIRQSIFINRSGRHIISLYYTNSKGFKSQLQSIPVIIEPAIRKSIITGINCNPSTIYKNEAFSITIISNFAPSGQKCNRFYWSIDGDTIWERTTDLPTESFLFSSDTVHLAVRCSDTNGFYSEIYRTILVLDPGIPVIDDILFSTHVSYIKKPFEIFIIAHDNPGGSIESSRIVLSSALKDTLVFNGTQLSIVPDTNICGEITVNAQVKDSAGHWSEWFLSEQIITINKGVPEIASCFFPDTVWFFNPAKLRFDAFDVDGILKRAIINWDDSCIDTININDASISTYALHTFSTQMEKLNRHVILTIEDDNYQYKTDTISVNVHKGEPSVKVGTSSISYRSGDTVYVKNENGAIKIPIYDGYISFDVQAFDSNGTIKKYYCDIDSPYSIDGAIGFSNTDRMRFYFRDNLTTWYFINVYPKAVLYAVDNDGFLGTDTFYICTDRPPRSPTIISPATDTIKSFPFNVIWNDGVDDQDGYNTNYNLNILYKSKVTSQIDIVDLSGIIKDIKVSSSETPQFKLQINRSLFNHGTERADIEFRLTLKDRLGQTSSYFFVRYVP